MSLRDEILNVTMVLFREKGLHFTMNDVALRMHIAKKTIYKMYGSKEKLMIDAVNHGFQRIYDEKQSIISSDLDITEKISRVLIAMPEDMAAMDWLMLKGLDEKYPEVSALIRRHIESNWEPVIDLLRQGMDEGKIRNIDIQILRQIITVSIESFLGSDMLIRNNISYQNALETLADIIMKGIKV